jgi:PAS domain-containing protein
MCDSDHHPDRTAGETQSAAHDRTLEILERISDAFFSVDRLWRFTYVNSQAERLLRRCRAELIGRNIWSEYPDAVGTIFHTEYEKSMADGTARVFEGFYPRSAPGSRSESTLPPTGWPSSSSTSLSAEPSSRPCGRERET